MTATRATAAPDARKAPCLGEGGQNSPRPFLGHLAKRTAYLRRHNPAYSTSADVQTVKVSLSREPWGQNE